MKKDHEEPDRLDRIRPSRPDRGHAARSHVRATAAL